MCVDLIIINKYCELTKCVNNKMFFLIQKEKKKWLFIIKHCEWHRQWNECKHNYLTEYQKIRLIKC